MGWKKENPERGKRGGGGFCGETRGARNHIKKKIKEKKR